jgi:hypothetical protein
MSGMSIWKYSGDQKDSQHMSETISALHKETDRSVAIVAAAIVDNALSAALLRFLHQQKKATDELFRSSGRSDPFRQKFILGFLWGCTARKRTAT